MMIKRQTLKHIISGVSSHIDYCNSLRNLGVMALLFKDPFVAAGVHGISRIGGGGGSNEQAAVQLSFFPRKVSGGKVTRINASSSEFNLRCCLDHFDDLQRKGDSRFQKAHAIAPYPEILRDSVAHLEEGKKSGAINGDGGINRRSPIEFPSHPMVDKLVVAVDVDEVLGNFVSALNVFIADRYSSKHSVSEYHVYEFFKIWNCSRDEADIRVHEFFKTSYFKKGILPIPGARNALHKLSKYCDLSIVTSRQHVIKDHTIEWIENHFPGLFQEIHFGNHFALDGNSRPKSDICRSLGAHVLIDDNPRYAIECADEGMRVLLFDYENMYPWSKTHSATQHPLVTKVHNWLEVEKQLLSWVTS